ARRPVAARHRDRAVTIVVRRAQGRRIAVLVVSFRIADLGIAGAAIGIAIVAVVAPALWRERAITVAVARGHAAVASIRAPARYSAEVHLLVAEATVTWRAEVDAPTAVGSYRPRTTPPSRAERALVSAIA